MSSLIKAAGLVTLSVFLQFCTSGESSWISYMPAGKAGFIPDSLRKVESFILENVDAGFIPGAAVLVAKDGKIVYEYAGGFRDTETKAPLKTTDLFRMMSMTKPVTSVAVMQLWEKGKIRLDDPLSKYIPEFANPTVLTVYNAADTTWESRPASREITVHDLLTHTSGIQYSFADPQFSAIYTKNSIPDLANTLDLTIGTVTQRMGAMPLAHDPGTKFTYGLNTDVLGRVVEVASGMTLAEYIENNITGPLKMTDTKFFFGEEYASRFISPYIMNQKDTSLGRMTVQGIYDGDYPVKGTKKYYSGGSGLSSTLQDYFIFCQMILDGGEYKGVRILQDSTVALMTSDRLGELKWSVSSSFGYGFRINRSRNAVGAIGPVIDLGWGGAFSTWFRINPERKIIEIFATQVLFNPIGDYLNESFDKIVDNSLKKEDQ